MEQKKVIPINEESKYFKITAGFWVQKWLRVITEHMFAHKEVASKDLADYTDGYMWSADTTFIELYLWLKENDYQMVGWELLETHAVVWVSKKEWEI